MIDQTKEAGKQLQAVVKTELKNYLGKDYEDDVLPLYIVVMLAHGNQEALVAENLDAFLGKEKAALFAAWLFKHLNENPGKYESKTPPTTPTHKEETQASAEAVEDESGTRKRSREKREKNDGTGEAPSKARPRELSHREDRDVREEKRRKSRDEGRASDRHDRENNRDRDYRKPSAADAREPESSRRYESRDGRGRPLVRENDRQESRPRRDEDLRVHKRLERDNIDRREGRAGRPSNAALQKEDRPSELEKPVRSGSRLAGRIGLPGSLARPVKARSPSQTPPREEARPSVFDRLTNGSQQRVDGVRTKMRMDSVPASQIDAGSLSYEDDEPLAAPSIFVSARPTEDLASELRQIRESLAKLQADKSEAAAKAPARQPSSELILAAMNSRKAVVHNVHFNANPDILKAHFSGCGNVASAIIEKDVVGNPKGIAVIEFDSEPARKVALTLSGSLLLGRPITVYAKESAPKYTPNAFRAPAPGFRPRAPAPGRGLGARGPGRATFPGRTTLKNNKYVRPQASQAQEANTGA